jgi:site-specific DNA-methyltransferase (adenine-specific)
MNKSVKQKKFMEKETNHLPIVLARKPLSEKTIVENVLRWGTGGINVDGCRIGSETIKSNGYYNQDDTGVMKMGISKKSKEEYNGNEHEGRFPANFIIECICDEVIPGDKGEPRIGRVGKDCDNGIYEGAGWKKDIEGKWHNDKGDIHTNPNCPCRLLDEQSGESKSNQRINGKDYNKKSDNINIGGGNKNCEYEDKGGASRFFYVPKVSKKERNMGLDSFEDVEDKGSIGLRTIGGTPLYEKGSSELINTRITKNNHPTVKPINLLTYLVRLITPPNGIVMDCYMGSGSTGIAAQLEGFNFIGMEMDEDYFNIAEGRINNWEQYKDLIKKK